VDSANVNASSNNDGFLNKKFYLQSYGGFRLKRLDGCWTGAFAHFWSMASALWVSYRRSVCRERSDFRGDIPTASKTS